jgi:hypothetical protein
MKWNSLYEYLKFKNIFHKNLQLIIGNSSYAINLDVLLRDWESRRFELFILDIINYFTVIEANDFSSTSNVCEFAFKKKFSKDFIKCVLIKNK